jgi:hypothetical protein
VTQIVLETLEPVDVVESGSGTDAVDSGPSRSSRLSDSVGKRITAVRNIPNIGTYVGVLLIAAGAVLIAVAWGKVAGLTNVGLQMPYVVSAGFTGLGLIASGLTVVNVSAKLNDSRERSRQVAELHGLLAELRRVVEEDPR